MSKDNHSMINIKDILHYRSLIVNIILIFTAYLCIIMHEKCLFINIKLNLTVENKNFLVYNKNNIIFFVKNNVLLLNI